jgi:hypothetical protein
MCNKPAWENEAAVATTRARPVCDHGVAAPDVFEDGRRATMWHYEWVLLYDYLPGLVGLELGRRPTLPAADGNRYSFADLLTIRTLTGET